MKGSVSLPKVHPNIWCLTTQHHHWYLCSTLKGHVSLSLHDISSTPAWVEITYPKKTCCNIKICSDMITLFYLWDFPTFPHLFFGCISSKVEKLHQKLPVAFVVRDEHIKAHDLMPWSELEFLITWEASSGFTWKKQTHTHYLKKKWKSCQDAFSPWGPFTANLNPVRELQICSPAH